MDVLIVLEFNTVSAVYTIITVRATLKYTVFPHLYGTLIETNLTWIKCLKHAKRDEIKHGNFRTIIEEVEALDSFYKPKLTGISPGIAD